MRTGLVLGASVAVAAGLGAVATLGAQPDADLGQRVDAIAAEVARLRGLAIQRPIEHGVMTRDQIRARLVARIGEEYGPDELAAEGLALERLGLVPAGADYPRLVLDLLTDQIAGFYDPRERRLYLAEGSPIGQDVAIAHEVDHALQDQHFGLERFLAAERKNGDATLARQALVEGDGTALMLEYVYASGGIDRSPWLDDRLVGSLAAMVEATGGGLAAAPLYLREGLLFPYTGGVAFVAHFRRLQPWRRIDLVFRQPPRSTEQILHPEKYEADERPVEVASRPLAALAGYRAVYDNVLGELGLSIWLRQHGVAAERARRAAAGWAGDRLAVWAPPDHAGGAVGAVALHMVVMDAEADAIEYFEAVTDALAGLARAAPRRREEASVEVGLPHGEAAVAVRRGEVVVMAIADAARAAEIGQQAVAGWQIRR